MQNLTGTKGGSGVWQRIISEMPEHDVYIEAFWGRGTIARRKRPAAITIGCDLDPDAISDGIAGGAIMFQVCGIDWLEGYFRVRSTPPQRTATLDPAAIDRQPGTAATIGGVNVGRHLVYLDPPYHGVPNYYRHAFDDHERLIELFLQLPCPAMLSGYQTDIYASRLTAARATQIPTTNRAGKRVTEWLWMNFPPPEQYHDTRYVGGGRRNRERIRRRVKRWRDALSRMPAIERQAIIDALPK